MSDNTKDTDKVSEGLNIAEKVIDLGERVIEKMHGVSPVHRADQIYVETIENDPQLSVTEKMALLYDAKNVKKHIRNQYKTYELANLLLKQKNSSLETSGFDFESEWFGMFNDIVKNVSNEEMLHIWAKILASKCENEKSVDKKLLSILQVMEYEDAEIFSYICANSVWVIDSNNEKYPAFIYPESNIVSFSGSDFDNIYKKRIINHSAFTQLQILGLISYHAELVEFSLSEYKNVDFVISYYGEKVRISSDSRQDLPLGKIEFTKCGCQLVNILHDGQEENKNYKLMDKIIEHYQNEKFNVIRV